MWRAQTHSSHNKFDDVWQGECWYLVSPVDELVQARGQEAAPTISAEGEQWAEPPFSAVSHFSSLMR